MDKVKEKIVQVLTIVLLIMIASFTFDEKAYASARDVQLVYMDGGTEKVVGKIQVDSVIEKVYSDAGVELVDRIDNSLIPKVDGYTFLGYEDSKNDLCISKTGMFYMSICTTTDNKLYAKLEPAVYEIEVYDTYNMTRTTPIFQLYKSGFYTSRDCKPAAKIERMDFTLPSMVIDQYTIDGYYFGTTKFTDETGKILCEPLFTEADITVNRLEPKYIPVVHQIGFYDGSELKHAIYEKFGVGFFQEKECVNPVDFTSKVPAAVIKKEGYKFYGYKKTGEIGYYINEEGEYTISNFLNNRKYKSDIRFEADLEAIKYNIRLTNIGRNPRSYMERYSKGGKYYDSMDAEVDKMTVRDVRGYKFLGYFDSTGTTQFTTADGTPTAALKCYEGDIIAKYEPEVHEIVLYKNDGKGTRITSFYEKYDDANFYQDIGCTIPITKVPVPTREGYDFEGYCYEETCITVAINERGEILHTPGSAVKDSEYYAKWSDVIVQLDIYDEDGFYMVRPPVYVGLGSTTTIDSVAGTTITKVSDLPSDKSADEVFKGIYAVKGDEKSTRYITSDGAILRSVYSLPASSIIVSGYAVYGKKDETPAVAPVSPGGTGGSRSGSGSAFGGAARGGKVQNHTGMAGWWRKKEGEWYYYLDEVNLYKGWLCENNTDFYYLDKDDGMMALGYRVIDGILYYFKEDGKVCRNELINDVYVRDDGQILNIPMYKNVNEVKYDPKVDAYYFADENGKMIENEMVVYDKTLYMADNKNPYKGWYPTVFTGNCKIGDIVLKFAPDTGGKLKTVYFAGGQSDEAHDVKKQLSLDGKVENTILSFLGSLLPDFSGVDIPLLFAENKMPDYYGEGGGIVPRNIGGTANIIDATKFNHTK